MEKGTGFFSALSALVAEAATLLASAVAILRGPLAQARTGLGRLETARDKAVQLVAKKRSERSHEEVKYEKELNAVRTQEQSAVQELSKAETAIREIEARIAEIDEGRSVAKFLLERVQADDYRKQLGIISTIRRDFSHLSGLLKGPALGSNGNAVDRIILYIDDLDRCPSSRVNEVLQAVHLLLAFDLFGIVVGVDPRWLMHSLEEGYTAFQKDGNGPVNRNSRSGATPRDYIEKIFQVPFMLRPMHRAGFGRLLERLLPVSDPEAASPPPAETALARPVHSGIGEGTLPAALPLVRPDFQGSHGHSGTGMRLEAMGSPDDPIRSEALVIRKWERGFADELFAFIPTPRAALRFANVYRLLKARLAREAIAEFEGTEQFPGTFRAPMLLLAILTGFPDQAESFFGGIQSSACAMSRDLFGEIPGKMGEDRLGKLGACLGPFLTNRLTVDAKDYREWAPLVARFSFGAFRSGNTA